MNYLRIWSGTDGETHFDDIEIAGQLRRSPTSSSTSEYGEPIPVTDMTFRRVVDETMDGEFHNAPRRQFVIHLRGGADIEVSDGEHRRVGPGDIVLVEDTTGAGHITRPVGPGPRETLFLGVPDREGK